MIIIVHDTSVTQLTQRGPIPHFELQDGELWMAMEHYLGYHSHSVRMANWCILWSSLRIFLRISTVLQRM